MTNNKQPGTIGAAVAHNAHFEIGDAIVISTDDGPTVARVDRVWTNGRYVSATTHDGRGGFVRDVTVKGQVTLL